VHGSLVREGPDVRLDFVLLSTDSGASPLARSSVSGPPDSIAALTDSAVHSLLRQVWTRGTAPTPSLEAALRTRSAQALRSFLEGERQVVGGWWDSAVVSFGRAREIDPGFWLAYSREQYAQAWSITPPVDSLVELLHQHRFDLPESERLVAEAGRLRSRDSIGLAIERDRQLTERYPSSWFAWLDYGDELLHNGPLLGYTREEAMVGFRRALERNPDLIPVHEHLMLAAIQDRDTAAARRGLGELARLNAGPSLTADGYGNRMLQFRYLDAIVRGDSALVNRLTDSIALDPAPNAIGDGSFYDAFRHGFPAEQITTSLVALRRGGTPGRVLAHARLLAFSWAARGAWDSALVALDRMAKTGIDSSAALRSYGLAVVGEWLGALGPDEADRHRASALPVVRTAQDSAEIIWLDGLRAAGRGDRRGLQAARTALKESGAPATASLDRSLAAFGMALDGSTKAAGTAMAALEWEQASLGAPDFAAHPWTMVVDRLAAARWLQATDPAQALRLLNVVDGAYMVHPSTLYSLMLSGLAGLERARIEARMGHDDLARAHYREFLRIYDHPVPRHATLVAEATAALDRP
jgi:tetratricopeptide (TPR) repeat protein